MMTLWRLVVLVCLACARSELVSPTLSDTTAEDVAYVNELTMYGAAELAYIHLDETKGNIQGGQDKTFTFSKANFLRLLDTARNQYGNGSMYRNTEYFLSEALGAYAGHIKDKTVLIYGSQAPAFEAYAVAYGAKEVVVVEYQLPPAQELEEYHISYIYPHQLAASGRRFDVVFSISSFEHDGLGRYGDPLSPNADLKTMQDLRDNVIVPGGLLFLAVPLGRDRVVWNLHRVYGYRRLVLLTQGWEPVDSFGLLEQDFKVTFPAIFHNQPVLVLRAPGGPVSEAFKADITAYVGPRAKDTVVVNVFRDAKDVLQRQGGPGWWLFPGDDGSIPTHRAFPACGANASYQLTHESLSVYAEMTLPDGEEEEVAWCVRRQLRQPNGIVNTLPRRWDRQYLGCITGSSIVNVTLLVEQQNMMIDEVPILVPEADGRLVGTVRVDAVAVNGGRVICTGPSAVVDTDVNGGAGVAQAAIAAGIATWDFVRGWLY